MAPSFDKDLMIVLNDVARVIRTRFDQRARAFGMTRAQWIILARLSRQPGMSQNEMAAICEVEPITVGRLIDRLESRGLVERRADPADRRIRRLHLLPGAQPIIDEISRYKDELHAELAQNVSGDDYKRVVDALLTIKENLSASPKLAMAGE